MPGDVNGLTRFRADPRKVRVSVRRDRWGWRASVRPREAAEVSYRETARREWVGRSPFSAARAIDDALLGAEDAGLDGIDLGMDWAFPHPWHVPADEGGSA